jgi:hypothetical protein
MQIEIDKLITVTNYAKQKNLSRQHVYRIAESKEITLIHIDSVAFIYLDDNAVNYERKRKLKTANS